MTPPSVVEAVGASRIMRDLLAGRTVKAGLTNCCNPAHDDEHPSMSVDEDAGVFNCFACGVQGGVLELAVLLGKGKDKAEAASMLADWYHVGNGHAKAADAAPWPYFPKTAEALGWQVGTEGDRRMLVCPTAHADGSKGRTKIRYEKRGKEPTARFQDDAEKSGLLNGAALHDALAGSEHPTVALLAGETDVLAWTWHANHEGIAIPAFSMPNGENMALGDVAKPLAGCKLLVLYDNDDVGRKEGPKRAAEALAAGADTAVSFHVPAPHKDVCDYLRAGGTVRELLKLSENSGAVADDWDFAVMLDQPDPPPPDQFVTRLFVRPSVNIVFGPAQAGKSWATMGLCLDAVMGGGEFLGSQDLTILPLRELRDGRTEKCLWIFGNEDTEGRVRRRLKLLHSQGPHAGNSIPRGAFVYATPPGGVSIHSPEGWKWLLGKIDKHGPTIVVLDTLASLTANTLDVNKQEQVAPFLSKLNVLRSEKNLIVFLLHHTRKASSDSKKNATSHADSMLGSGAFRSLCEGVLMLDAPDGDTSRVTVRSIKAKDIEDHVPAFRVSMEKGTGRFRVLDEDEVPEAPAPIRKTGRKPAVTADMIFALSVKFPDGILWNQIQSEFKVPDGTWRNNSSSLKDEVLKLGCVFLSGVLKWPR